MILSEIQPSHMFVRKVWKVKWSSNTSNNAQVLMHQQICQATKRLCQIQDSHSFEDYRLWGC